MFFENLRKSFVLLNVQSSAVRLTKCQLKLIFLMHRLTTWQLTFPFKSRIYNAEATILQNYLNNYVTKVNTIYKKII